MILQALKEYYDRKAADPDSGIDVSDLCGRGESNHPVHIVLTDCRDRPEDHTADTEDKEDPVDRHPFKNLDTYYPPVYLYQQENIALRDQ